ncbi:hypothetical protein [Nitrosomonas sp. Nm166]|uniref:hypothetical protein n=1 Tax=Nitrosomonas sp. Nm166 TaxID=1881054 RepID=UPI0008E32853|nr:hypothetical protein [Nitrosomonas sp. Nm166]SFE76189.1 hypothetical protein SAMN05428977_102840 [Nitrosomonas sp. Nm166]
MNDEERKIIIDKVSEYHQKESGEYQRVPISTMHRWLTYAMLIPVVVVLVLIGVFFFAAFLTLLLVAVVVIGIRFWWLRRNFESTMHQPDDLNDFKRQTESDRAVVIEDAQIIEETEVHSGKQKK